MIFSRGIRFFVSAENKRNIFWLRTYTLSPSANLFFNFPCHLFSGRPGNRHSPTRIRYNGPVRSGGPVVFPEGDPSIARRFQLRPLACLLLSFHPSSVTCSAWSQLLCLHEKLPTNLPPAASPKGPCPGKSVRTGSFPSSARVGWEPYTWPNRKSRHAGKWR